jgi:hypothetical protein
MFKRPLTHKAMIRDTNRILLTIFILLLIYLCICLVDNQPINKHIVYAILSFLAVFGIGRIMLS